ncbi:MAG: protein-disulfide reductase DsbD [Rhodobacteraceae bacterium]|nr:protein-disulfide reductase DsbD [Paracoccaceae bacterium]
MIKPAPSCVHMRIARLVIPVIALVMLASVAVAQSIQWSTPAGDAPLPADQAFVLYHEVAADGRVTLTWQVTPGYYLYQDKLQVDAPDGPVALDLPQAELTDDLTFGTVYIYRDDISIDLPPVAGTIAVTWQGCQDGGICYAPQSRTISIDAGGSPAATTPPVADGTGAQLTLAGNTGLVDRLGAYGVPVLLLAFFGFGLALAFTPCVLPMVPILGGYLARDGAAMTRRRGFALSSSYVLAMALAFGALGLAAAATGQNLQMVLQSPVVLSVIIALFVVLAASMFGMFEISLPASWTARLQGAGAGRRGTVTGAAALGFTSALVVGPCVTAPLAAALLYIAQTGDMMLGSAALFALGLGKGTPLVVFGTLGPKYLPRSGPWMVRVKQAFGFVFLGLALWLADRMGTGPWGVAGWGLLFLAFSVFVWRALLRDVQNPRSRVWVRAVAIVALLPALVLVVGASRGADDPLRPFQTGHADKVAALDWQVVSDKRGLDSALGQADGASVIYLTADWCVSCRTIDRRVMPDPDVVAALDPLTRIKLDLSTFDAAAQALLQELGAAGPPTMIFLDDMLQEAGGTRLVGETRAAPVIASAAQVQP